MRKTITEAEKLQLLGLQTLGREYYKKVDIVRDEMTRILGTDDSLLHDSIWDYDQSFDESFKVMGLEVTDAAS